MADRASEREDHARAVRGPRPLEALVTGIAPERQGRARVERRFRALLDAGAELRPAGRARRRPTQLLTPRYLPRHEVRLFDASYFLADYRFDDSVGFFVGYVALSEDGTGRVATLWPRLFYKDSSLLWRVASHFSRHDGAPWIGKGDTRIEERGPWVYEHSAEETTNLPYELCFAFDRLSRACAPRRDATALERIVREAPPGRIRAYADFCAPRRRAAGASRENGGRPVAFFQRKGDPTSLRFAHGYAPDFRHGIVERGISRSAFFGGRVEKRRILSTNRRVQYLFLSSPTQVWIAPPQRLTTELTSYGVRAHDVQADEELFLPGFEYHEEGDSQIPAGFAGAPHPHNPDRADTSAWLEALPVVRAFRAQVLARGRQRASSPP